MGKIYLSSYYTRNYNVPKGTIFINVARKDMDGINNKIIELAPNKELFNWYWRHKEESNWFDYYKEEYKRQIITNKATRKILIELRDRVLSGEDICLLCFCRKANKCHRSLLGDMFKNYGIEIIDTDKTIN